MECPEGPAITGGFCLPHPYVSVEEREQREDWINMFLKKIKVNGDK